RFTPRKKNSVWSNVNTKRVQELIDEGRMQEQGLKAFEARDEKRAGLYSFENELQLTPAFIRKFRANKKAWAHFSSRPPGYKRTSIHWVMSAKQETTRQRRLGILIANSENGRPIPLLDRGEKT
ncbi:MAG TPA: YdeI/OmpD-associated family protein, partial [Chitinophagaceae bacterium]|nr:YdeI/OmpD-associated family protein [Chitinophagaceae bacterium]